jgi:microcystin-dependent protein
MDFFIGTVMPFAFRYNPDAWLPCNGQQIAIAQYSTLFTLIGITYGGDGRTTFALPNLNGIAMGTPSPVVIGQGSGPGLTTRTIGQTFGSDTVTLTQAQVPPHNHGFQLFPAAGATASPAGKQAISNPSNNGFLPWGTAPAVTLAPNSLTLQGNGQAHNNDQPTLEFLYCICFAGIYPSFD